MSKIRIIAAQITYAVVFKKINLAENFKQRLSPKQAPEIKSAIKALCYTTIRHYWQLEDVWLQCVSKKPKDKMVQVIMTQGLAEFKYMHKPAHAIVDEAIKTAKNLHKSWAAGLINATLRKAVVCNELQASSEMAKYSHPQWWIDKLKADWQQHWQQILIANNQKPPLWVRAKSTVALPLAHSSIKNAYKLEPQDITTNQDFVAGKISVQDASAQLAAYILNPQDGDEVLDMCAAPGGKTCHLLELNNRISLDAIEIYANRAAKIQENLQRLGLTAKVIIKDATKLTDNKKYHKILLDAPCSASGIVRRQPDIKFQRMPQDLMQICQTQGQLLASAAKVLMVNGMLLYVTCSVFKQENSEQIEIFLKTHPQFSEIKLKYPFAINCEYGIQIISGTEDMDGFYYCLLKKNAT